MSRVTLVWIGLSVLLVLAGLFYAVRGPILAFPATFLIAEDPLERADAILVLTGDTPRRAIEAADLFREGYAPLVLLSRDEEEPGYETLRERGIGPEKVPSRNDLNRSVALALGVPAERIKPSPHVATRTAEEAKAAVRWIKEIGGIRRLLVVTSQTHTKRAGKIIRRAFAKTGVEIRMRGARLDPIDPRNWWRINYQRRAVGYEWTARLAAPFISKKE